MIQQAFPTVTHPPHSIRSSVKNLNSPSQEYGIQKKMHDAVGNRLALTRQAKERGYNPPDSNSLRDGFGWRFPVGRTNQPMFDFGFWDCLEGAGFAGAGVDTWSAFNESTTWPITHSTSSTASSKITHSSSDLMESAHHAVDRTTRNNPFCPRAPTLTQLVMPSLSLGSGHSFWHQDGWHAVHHSIQLLRYEGMLETKGVCSSAKDRFFVHCLIWSGRDSAERRV